MKCDVCRVCSVCCGAVEEEVVVGIVGRLRVTTSDYMFPRRISRMNKGKV